jgi:hypothetical protein
MIRLIFYLRPLSMIPLYLSFIPYIVFQIISREAHIVFSILWFTSIMSINLQLGTNKLRYHIVIASICYCGICPFLLIILSRVYSDLRANVRYLQSGKHGTRFFDCL